ncbi:MAG: SIR2 family protein [Bacteroidota bacterium]
MTEDQWTQLINAIEQKVCILLLGPATSTLQKGGKAWPLANAFAQELAKTLKEKEIEFEAKEDSNLRYIAQRYLTIPNMIPTQPAYLAQDFFRKYAEVSQLHLDLAALPFYLIINTNPDDLIRKAFEQANKEYVAGYYHFKKDAEKDIEEAEEEQCIIYNIFGDLNKDYKSVIVTEQDQIEFTSKIMEKKPRIPTKITSEFDREKVYLLLGFNYEEWHLRLLLDSFNLQDNIGLYTPSKGPFSITKPTEQFFSSAFRFRFIDNDIPAFVEELKRRHQAAFGNQGGDPEAPEKALNLVLLCAKKDEDYRTELLKYIQFLAQKNYVNIWHRGLIEGGEVTAESSQSALEKADLVLPLLSSDLLADENFQDQWQVISQKEIDYIPIIIRSCVWEETPLANAPLVLPAPRGSKPVKSMFWNSADDAFKAIAESLKEWIFDYLIKNA